MKRFTDKIIKLNGGCHEWVAKRDSGGYGQFWMSGKHKPAHRVAWVLAHSEIPDGMCVLHKCDNRACVNVEHLFLGTHADNMADMTKKGRGRPQGQRPKLSFSAAEEIRRAYKRADTTMSKLSRRFGVSINQISLVVNNHAWSK